MPWGPCAIPLWRSLAHISTLIPDRINTDLGALQGKKHSTPDLTKDIDTLMASLKLHKVYVYNEGCVLNDNEEPAVDIISVGLATLTHSSGSNPLDKFNAQFNQVQEQRQIKPISELLHHPINQPAEVSTSSPSMITVAPNPTSHYTHQCSRQWSIILRD